MGSGGRECQLITEFVQTLMGSETLRDIIITINVLLFAVTFLLFLVLLFHKLHVERRAKKLEQLRETYLADLAHRFYDPSHPVHPPQTFLEYEALGNVVATMLVNVSGEMAENIRRCVRELGVDVHYREMLGSRRWVRRFIAVEKLGYFRFPELKPVFESVLAGEKDSRIIPKAVWALSLIAQRTDLPTINRILRDPLFMSGKFNEYIYTNIIRSFREHEQDALLVEVLDELMADPELPVLLKRDIIQACGAEMFFSAQKMVLSCFTRFRDVAEMRIACIRTLERFSAVDEEWLLTECLRDPDWRIRGVAAKNAHLYSPDIISPLRNLLHDESYHVRINSAHALAKMGEAGLDVLVEETQSEDRFVRDVSQYVLKRLIYAS